MSQVGIRGCRRLGQGKNWQGKTTLTDFANIYTSKQTYISPSAIQNKNKLRSVTCGIVFQTLDKNKGNFHRFFWVLCQFAPKLLKKMSKTLGKSN